MTPWTPTPPSSGQTLFPQYDKISNLSHAVRVRSNWVEGKRAGAGREVDGWVNNKVWFAGMQIRHKGEYQARRRLSPLPLAALASAPTLSMPPASLGGGVWSCRLAGL